MKTQLLATLEKSERYTLAVAGAMPEGMFNFKPTDGVWSFSELLNHIGYGIHWWTDNYIIKVQSEWNPPVPIQEPEEVVRYLEDSFASLKKVLHSRRMDDDIIHGVYATLDHITHHRGQATTYLRMKNITPPEYTF